jgi:hypothetical protein
MAMTVYTLTPSRMGIITSRFSTSDPMRGGVNFAGMSGVMGETGALDCAWSEQATTKNASIRTRVEVINFCPFWGRIPGGSFPGELSAVGPLAGCCRSAMNRFALFIHHISKNYFTVVA